MTEARRELEHDLALVVIAAALFVALCNVW